MTTPIAPVAATPTPAPITETPAVPIATNSVAQGPLTGKSAAVVTPVPDALKPTTPTAPAKTLLEQAGGEQAISPLDTVLDTYHKAMDAHIEDPTDETKAALEKARLNVKSAATPQTIEASTVPTTYEMKAQEGQAIDAALLSEATPMLREAGLSNEGLQKLMPVVGKIQDKAISSYVANQQNQKTEADTAEQKATKEALGPKWQEKMALAAKARDRLFSETFRNVLMEHGNNLSIIQDLISMGEKISEGKLVDGRPTGAGKTASEILYPSMST